jgi:hypothetical protein
MLPALRLTAGQLVEGIVAELGSEAGGRVSWTPQPGVEERYAQFPALTTAFADSLGFRRDADLETLVRRTFSVVTQPKRKD